MKAEQVLHSISKLSYREMQRLSSLVSDSCDVDAPTEDFCEAFAAAAEKTPEVSEISGAMAETLSAHFNRQRVIKVTPCASGWKISSSGVPDTFCADLMEGMVDFLEVLVAFKGLIRD